MARSIRPAACSLLSPWPPRSGQCWRSSSSSEVPAGPGAPAAGASPSPSGGGQAAASDPVSSTRAPAPIAGERRSGALSSDSEGAGKGDDNGAGGRSPLGVPRESPAILVVDDDRATAEELGDLVAASGYKVRTATDPVRALHDLVDSPEIGIALIDLRMPRLDGISLVQALARQRSTRLRVIFMSGQPTLPDAVAALRVEAVDLLIKPIRRTELQAALLRSSEAALRQRREQLRNHELRQALQSMAAQCLRVLNSDPAMADVAGRSAASQRAPNAGARAPEPQPPAQDRGGTTRRAPAASREDVQKFLRERLESLLNARRARALFFDQALFEDPCWDMLLELMHARLADRPISVSSLCIAVGVPQTTGLRRIEELERHGLLMRKPDPVDRRRVFLDLTQAGIRQLEHYLTTAVDAP